MSKGNVVAIIPARYTSTRLPGKPLVEIARRPMVIHVYERAQAAQSVSRVIVATDDTRVLEAVQSYGGEAVMTSPEHRSGTDRLAEVAASLSAEIIVNVQGDEPLIEPSTIDAAVAPLIEDPRILMSTTREPIESVEDAFNPNVVKVVTDSEGFALYFSRSPIPYPRTAGIGDIDWRKSLPEELQQAALKQYFKHTGMYAYRRQFLLKYASLPSTPLEKLEALEQLRALEHGFRIKVVTVPHRSIGVDTPEDLERVRRIIEGGAESSANKFLS